MSRHARPHRRPPRDPRFWAARLQLVRERFGFLERDHGFAAPVVHGDEVSLCIAFAGDGINVSFGSDRSEPPIVSVTVLEPCASFTLAEAIELVDPDHLATRPRTRASALSDADFASWLDHYAGFLSRHAREVLIDAASLAARLAERRARE
ncbi:MAG: hypothetical protein HYY06_28150 [Deltaproteobacteria bacterium]|nr:hypothetical protein [Deltaproteobacteria bacterium]